MVRLPRLPVIALVSIGWLIPAPAVAQTELEVSVSTDQDQYHLGETVSVQMEVCNPTGQSVLAHHNQLSCGSDQFQVHGESDGALSAFSSFQPWCPPWLVPIELDAGECQVLATWQWPQVTGGSPEPGTGQQVAAGFYLVRGQAFGNVLSDSYRFEILAQQPPVVPSLTSAGLALMVLTMAAGGTLLLLSRRSS